MQNKRKSIGRISYAKSLVLALLLSVNDITNANDVGITPMIVGADLFGRGDYRGIGAASLAGGTEIMFNGQGMSMTPENFQVLFTQSDINFEKAGQALSKDNSFNSNTHYGKLEYTTPSLMTLFGRSYDELDFFDQITFDLSLIDSNMVTGRVNQLACDQPKSKCQITMSRSFTPVLYYMQPRVVHHGSETSFFVDPRAAQNYRLTHDLPFQEGRIDNKTLNFEEFVTEDTVLNGWSKNSIRANVYEVSPNPSAAVSLKWRVGNSLQKDSQMVQCDINNQNCYKVKVVPVINQVSASSGYTTGGQTLQINGYGFDSDNINVKVDGVDCSVLSHSTKSLTCKTGAQISPSTGSFFVGSYGLRRRFYNITDYSEGQYWGRLNDTNLQETTVALSFENPINIKDNYSGSVYSGYFKPPTTGTYRFYMSCDDSCILNMNVNGSDTKDPSGAIQLLSAGYSSYRNYLNPGDTRRQTEWLSLRSDKYYYIEGRHLQYNGGDHFTVSVEIGIQSQVHQNAMKEIQRLQINPENIREQHKLIVRNPADGQFDIGILQPGTTNLYLVRINTLGDANHIRGMLNGYWSTYFGCSIQVTLDMQDANGDTVTNMANSVLNTFTISVLKAQATDTITTTPAIKLVSGTSSVSFTKAVVKSTQVLSGNFIIKCAQSNGELIATGDIPTSYQPYQIYNAIVEVCPNYKDKINIWDGPAYSYNVDGRDILIRFTDISANIVQFTIESSATNITVGNNVQFAYSTYKEYGESLFYEPIPFEFIHTDEVTPQVQVTVMGLPAVCASLSCGYVYQDPVGEISQFTLDSNTLTITGTDLPVQSDIGSIVFANVECTITSITTTEIVCSLASQVAGAWSPILTDFMGLIPIASARRNLRFLQPSLITVPLIVSSLTPNTDVNPNGGSKLTIVGQNFPTSIKDGSSLDISFTDNSKCAPLTSSSNQITCKLPKFSAAGSQSVIITVNAQQDSSQSIVVSTSPAALTSLNPEYVSPVLKQQIVIQVDPTFTGTLDIAELTVKLVDTDADSTYSKAINIVDVDDVNKRITVKYGGIYSGIYNVNVFSETYGMLDNSAVTLKAVGEILSFTPTQGSIYGGTLITITGRVFSTEATDNPVKVGTTDCLVESTTSTQIQCRLQPRLSNEASEDVIVFLKTSEEALCSTGSNCLFTWLSDASLPAITSYNVAYNTDINDYQVTLTGTGFPTSSSDVTFKIDGAAQTIASATETSIVVTIISMLSSTSKNIEVNFASGTPVGANLLTTTGITLTPVIVSTSPSVGSPGGSLLSAVVKGVGTASTLVNLISSTSTVICQTVTIIAYGQVQCQTKTGTQAATVVGAQVGNLFYQCVDSTQCGYETSASMPAIASLALSSDKTQMIFTGTNFFTADYSASVTYIGLNAATVTIDSDSQVTATWTYGVPISATVQAPTLVFTSQSSNVIKHTASSTQTISNAFTATQTSSSIDCSFAGGCLLSIEAPGLATSLATSGNEVRVCDKTCVLDTAESTSTSLKCRVPKLSTTYSVTNYKIEEESYIMGTVFASNTASITTLTDDQNQTPYSDTSATCNFGAVFASNHIGQLSEVKFFMPVFVKTNFVGKLAFQGSNDGSTYDTIFTVGNEIHEGWNYYSYRENNLKYRYYKFQGNGVGSCRIGEMKFRGVETIADTQPTYTCPVTVQLSGTTTTLTGQVNYLNTKTSLLTDISPRYGKVQGGETITFTGTGFSSTTTDYTIKIDNIVCAVQTASSTEVTCITGSRPGLYPTPTLVFQIAGQGNVATQAKVFRYVNYWSLVDTWGGEFLPIEDESVYIPAGLHLLVDVDSTPILKAVIVEGSLIFPPDEDETHQRTFDAHYIMIQGGYMEVGTEEFPYTSKLTITMHSNKESPELPIYGNKCIAVRNGILDFHGVPRTPTWTELDHTANIGDTTITMIQAVDWKAGEDIVIAPSGYDNREAEVRTIVSVLRTNVDKPVITLDKPLQYKHYSDKEYYEDNFIEMRAEVGLLTRNVVYRGDPETSSKNQFGAHIMLHSAGDESLTGRIEYIELRDVGQAFQLGRYPLHFHLIGTVHNSYIRGNAIHHTYNRAVTIHAVHYLRVLHNVAYHTMGHTFFIEDAVETKNLIQGNLAVQTMASMSLLNTDQTPASFWITHPDNIFKDNHAAGSDRYGYWFDTKPHPMGPSFTEDVCPENAQLGEFSNNVAHSNGKYGLRIFHKLIPRQDPCRGLTYNATNVDDPYSSNPLVTAFFYNLTSWKNHRNGAIAEQVGDVRFVNFKVADNLVGGIEFSLTGDVVDGHAQIIDALVIGHSGNAEEVTMNSTFHGIITPRTENFQVNGAKFYNWDQPGQACFGSCSHCFHPAATDSGARTITFSKIYFHSSAVTKIRYQFPFRDIFYDTDGTLTGKLAGSWATPYWEHNVQPECEVKQEEYDGILCDNTVEIRRLVHYSYAPNIFENMEFKVLKYDDNLYTNSTEYIGSRNNLTDYSIVPFKPKLDPKNAWAVPYVTGHKYKIHWRFGLDFVQMQVDQSIKWKETDKDIYFVYNFTDVRVKVDFITGGVTVPNNTLVTKAKSTWSTGDNVVYNDTATREIHTVFNGRNVSRRSVVMKGYRCDGPCLSAIIDVPVETNVRRWSDPKSWTSGKVPLAGEDVVVESGWNMLYDIENSSSPIYRMVQINGRLTFDNENAIGKNLYLYAKYIFVRAGQLIIGNETRPFKGTANIVLHGEKANEQIVYDEAIEAGNKVLANTGIISMYGTPRIRMTRLLETVYAGSKTFKVEAGLSWNAGEKIALGPTTLQYEHSDYAIIQSYDNATGQLTITTGLLYYHWGAAVSTAANFNGVDMRGEVYLLNRNIKISGFDSEMWGCNIVTSDFMDFNQLTTVLRKGSTYMNNVEIYNCSQYDTYKAAIRFQGNGLSWSEVVNSAIYFGWGYGAQFENAANVKLTNNTFFSFVKRGINIATSSNITLDGNHIVHIQIREFIAIDHVFEPTGCVLSCTEEGEVCTDISIVNNVASGSPFTGFAAYGHPCGQTDQKSFRNNIAHSNKDTGAILFADKTDDAQFNCFEGSYFAAYKNGLDGAVSFHHQSYKNIIFTKMTFIDNGFGGTPMVGIEGDDLSSQITDSLFYGETEARDCLKENQCDTSFDKVYCIDKSAIQTAYFAKGGKPPLPKTLTQIPVHKIKTDASFGGKTTYTNLQFFNYNSNKTFCGMQQVVFKLNHYAADYIPKAKLIKPKFVNIHQDAMAYLFTPPVGWANLDDCGDFPCTAPNNALIQFEGATFSGLTPTNTDKYFQILPNNKAAVQGYSSCKSYQAWNGYYCTNDNLGVLLFESIDDDKWKRMISPIQIVNNVTTSKNTLNTFMDHIWDGFYTGQLRLSRWPTTIETGMVNGVYKTYDIIYSGTPPGNQRFWLQADEGGVILRIDYTKPGAYIVTDFLGATIEANKWNDKIKAIDSIKGSKCGENRYLGIQNILEFYLSAGCKIMIKPVDSIKTSIRMDWTLSAFYAAGGTTKFIDRVASALGIHASTIKVVSVYQGSVYVDFTIIPDNNKITATTVQTGIQNAIKANSNVFGAPVLSASAGGTTVIKDGTAVVNTNTNTGTTTGTTTGTKTPVIDTSKIPQVTIQSGGSDGNEDQVKLIVILVVIVVVIIIGSVASYFIYQKYQKKQNDRNMKKISQGAEAIAQNSKDVSGLEVEHESYEPQYHPKTIDIFKGQIEKINEADECNDTEHLDGDGLEVNTDHSQIVDQDKQYEQSPLHSQSRPSIDSEHHTLGKKRSSMRVQNDNDNGSKKVYQNVNQ